MKTFKELKLCEEMLEVIQEMGLETPTEIQEKAIPLALEGRDIIGGSATGSGKTLAFAAPIVQNLKKGKGVQALVMTPTRELAEQVAKSIRKFAGMKRLKVLPIYGGVDIRAQMRRIEKSDVIVGTPGRILDHLNRRTLDLKKIKILVLDEVDRMLDMGFYKDVDKIISQCGKERQTMLFSATISADIDHLSKTYTKNATEVVVKSYIDHSKLKQVFYDVPGNKKFSLFMHLLGKEKLDLVMVFCNTKRMVDLLSENLKTMGIEARAIHGGLTQAKRLKVLKEFNDSGINVLVCTDVAARGLDISGVSHVYNYDLPDVAADYVHRIGRTARAGKNGIAINLLCDKDYDNFNSILSNKNLRIEEKDLPRFDFVKMTHIVEGRGRGRSDSGRGNFGGRGRSRDSGRSGSRSYSQGSSSRERSYSQSNSRDSGRSSSYGRKPSTGRSYSSRDSGRSNSKSYGRSNSRNPSGRYDRKPSTGSRSYSRGSSSSGSSYDRKPSEGRKPYSRGSSSRERSYSQSNSRDSGRSSSYGRKPSTGGRTYNRSSSEGKKSFSRKPSTGGRKSYGSKKPYERKSSNEGKKSYGKKY